MSESKPPQEDAAVALLGEPVDPRRPFHMSRTEYLATKPGLRTRHDLDNAGILKRQRLRRALWIVAALTGMGLVLSIGWAVWS